MAVCNLNCLCINSDCNFYHAYPIKERRIIRNIFDNLDNPNKNESNPDLRRANCRFGQLCHNKNCGYRHRLSFDYRNILIDKFNHIKLQSAKIEKTPKIIQSNHFNISNSNSFLLLDLDEPSIQTQTQTPIINIPSKSWADIVGDNDDDFYMKFD